MLTLKHKYLLTNTYWLCIAFHVVSLLLIGVMMFAFDLMASGDSKHSVGGLLGLIVIPFLLSVESIGFLLLLVFNLVILWRVRTFVIAGLLLLQLGLALLVYIDQIDGWWVFPMSWQGYLYQLGIVLYASLAVWCVKKQALTQVPLNS